MKPLKSDSNIDKPQNSNQAQIQANSCLNMLTLKDQFPPIRFDETKTHKKHYVSLAGEEKLRDGRVTGLAHVSRNLAFRPPW
eukprot:1284575-Amorphochlora_amoeboformis.AAC.1